MEQITTASWHTFETDAPELAAAARAQFEWTKHHVLATLRADGSPRVQGTEVQFHDGELMVGMMHGSVKALDLVRDGRFALHASMTEPMGSGPGEGDIKVSGFADEVTDRARLESYIAAVQPPPPFQLFRFGIREVVRTSLRPEGDGLIVERWMPTTGLTRRDRSA